MKRRAFIRTSAVAGTALSLNSSFAAAKYVGENALVVKQSRLIIHR